VKVGEGRGESFFCGRKFNGMEFLNIEYLRLFCKKETSNGQYRKRGHNIFCFPRNLQTSKIWDLGHKNVQVGEGGHDREIKSNMFWWKNSGCVNPYRLFEL